MFSRARLAVCCHRATFLACQAPKVSTRVVRIAAVNTRLFSSLPDAVSAAPSALSLNGQPAEQSKPLAAPATAAGKETIEINTAGEVVADKPVPELSEAEKRALSVKFSKMIHAAAREGKRRKLLNLILETKDKDVRLGWKECMVGLSQCVKHCEKVDLAAISQEHHIDLPQLVNYIMSELRRADVANHEAYLCAMRIYRELKDPQQAQTLMVEFVEHGDVPLTEQLQGEYVKAVATAALKSPGDTTDPTAMNVARRWFFMQKVVEGYEKYLSLRSDNQLLADRDVYIAAARAYSIILGGRIPSAASSVISVFEQMARDGFEPDFAICRFVLAHALLAKNASVTQVMVQWFLQHFDYPLEDGAISEVFGIATRDIDMVLGNIALKAREKAYYINCASGKAINSAGMGSNGASAFDYASLLSIAIRSKNVAAAVEVLHEAEDVGVNIGSISFGKHVLEDFTIYCSHSINLLDSLYYALVDLARLSPEKKVPKYALTTVISAAGRMGQYDRAFATFTEYSTMFGLTHDIDSYNALLAASARHKYPRVLPLLQILQDMEGQGIAPDSVSFSYLIDVMSESGDMSSLSKALQMMDDRGVTARPRSLRRAAYRAVDLDRDDLVQELKKAMASKKTPFFTPRHPDNLHHFFKVYLDKKMSERDKHKSLSGVHGHEEEI